MELDFSQSISDFVRTIDTHCGVEVYSVKKCYMISTRNKMVGAKEVGSRPSPAHIAAMLEAQMKM